ncbi:methanogenesis marker 2 protein [Methanocella sp. CWC-04]|uniref:Methanogenesis marker 2 protein n=1 Tax=Methanooceanicella nereidis TaxID=2052831 RepID=A0AAP2RB11_9EURY|nr:methanogenesis marker 2 protein [Methanocella sp. CWC-04]MCD1294214.1 methanogenesis marker 2 protein [Methanocella sp. CWC-04]
MNLERLAESLREYLGATRKHSIKNIVSVFDEKGSNPSFGEDAAIIDRGEEALLLAADGIWDKLMRADPEWSGYCSILVNVHDIAAMGGRPLGMVDVFSSNSQEISEKVLRGMKTGVEKFGVPVVGGHVHPDTPYAALDVAILGVVRKDSIIYSSTARPGDDVVLAIDMDGRVHPSCDLNWDTTYLKEPAIVRDQLSAMVELGESKLLTAGKDVSNPGIIGTLGMLLEVSGVGADVDINLIPKPPELDHMHWLRMYPGMGFIVTCTPENTEKVIEVFANHKLNACKIGKIVSTRKLDIMNSEGERATVFDFTMHDITGLRPVKSRCNV